MGGAARIQQPKQIQFTPITGVQEKRVFYKKGEALKTQKEEFLELVNCEPEEVSDTPSARRYLDPIAEVRRYEGRVSGSYTLHFGKHKGKRLDEVPREYLEWLAVQDSRGKFKSMRSAKKKIKTYLLTQ